MLENPAPRPLAICIVAICLWSGYLYAEDAPKDSKVSPETKDSTNVQPSKKTDNLIELEQSLFRPFKGLSDKGPVDAALPAQINPTQPNPAQARRTKELMDRRKNWMFMTPEELVT